MEHQFYPRYFLVALMLVILSTVAQAQVTLHTYSARLESENPYATPKPLFVAIVDEYSTADVAHDRDTQILTISTSFTIEQHWLASISEQSGFRLTGLWRDGVDIFWREVGPEDVAGAPTAPPAPINSTPADEN